MPPDGVYAGWPRRPPGGVSIGTNPHFDGVERRVEAHLLDFDGDLYGQRLVVELWSPIREQRRFDSLEELVAAIGDDVEQTRTAVRPGCECRRSDATRQRDPADARDAGAAGSRAGGSSASRPRSRRRRRRSASTATRGRSIRTPVTGSVSLSATRQRRRLRRATALDVVERVAARARCRLAAGSVDGEPARARARDDAPDQPAAAPAVREHREHELLLRDEQEQRLVAADRSLVVERGVRRRAHAPTSRGSSGAPSASRPRLAQPRSAERPAASWCAREAQQVADRRPEPARRPPRLRILDVAARARCPVSPSWTCPRAAPGGSSKPVLSSPSGSRSRSRIASEYDVPAAAAHASPAST